MFVNGPSGRIASYTGDDESNPAYYLTDHLGTARVIMSDQESGTRLVQQFFNYHPFGEVAESWGLIQTNFKFTGKELDDNGNFDHYYFGARYYNPELGSFSSVDKLGQFASGFAYGNNNPIMGKDPDGNWYRRERDWTRTAERQRRKQDGSRRLSAHETPEGKEIIHPLGVTITVNGGSGTEDDPYVIDGHEVNGGDNGEIVIGAGSGDTGGLPPHTGGGGGGGSGGNGGGGDGNGGGGSGNGGRGSNGGNGPDNSGDGSSWVERHPLILDISFDITIPPLPMFGEVGITLVFTDFLSVDWYWHRGLGLGASVGPTLFFGTTIDPYISSPGGDILDLQIVVPTPYGPIGGEWMGSFPPGNSTVGIVTGLPGGGALQ